MGPWETDFPLLFLFWMGAGGGSVAKFNSFDFLYVASKLSLRNIVHFMCFMKLVPDSPSPEGTRMLSESPIRR